MLTATGEVKQLSFWGDQLGRYVVILIRGEYLYRSILATRLYYELLDNFSPILMSLEKFGSVKNLLTAFEDRYIVTDNVIIVEDWKEEKDRNYVEENGFYDVITIGIYNRNETEYSKELNEICRVADDRKEILLFTKDFVKKYFTKEN